MPNYPYHCAKCDVKVNIFHSITDESDRYCEVCESKLERLICTGTGFKLVGPGFYANDYKGEK